MNPESTRLIPGTRSPGGRRDSIRGALAAFRVTLGILLIACRGGDTRAATSLDDGFHMVPMSDRPWAYWWWLKGNVTEQSITRDLEAMKQQGIGGLLMFDSRGYHETHVVPPPARMEFMSPEWRRLLRFALAEANRLGLTVSVNLSSSAGALKGPWAVGEDAPKQLLWTSAEVRGPRRLSCVVQPPEGKRLREIALLAIRHEEWRESGTAAPEEDRLHQPEAADHPAVILSGPWKEVASGLSARPAAVEVLDLSKKLDAQGRLDWNVPDGRWTLLRFGWAVLDGHEYDVDILDAKAVTGHFERMGRVLLRDAGPLAGRTLTHFYSVSWEGAAPTWTRALPREFRNYRDYDLRPWLPVLAGYAVRNRVLSERFLDDYYKTLGDCFMNNFYGTLHRLCARAGLKWHSESGGPWNRRLAAFEQADQLAFLARNDMPQGEFWWTGRAFNRPVAMAAHIYGKRLAAAEAFTHMARHWSAYPATLKPQADRAFCDGINHLVWHTFTASPPELGQPGSEYFAGTHLNPNVTWWPQAGPFLACLGRSQFLLRQGRFVADVCAYVGDQTYLHWDRGSNWTDTAGLRLGPGYAYDLLNTEVLRNRLSVKKGRLVLPDGMSYRLLVVDLEDDAVPPTVLRRLRALAQAGATIVLGQRQPQRAPGLTDYPDCDEDVRRLAAELWGRGGSQPSTRSFGRGRLVAGTTMADVFRAIHLPPDFEGPWNYTHRRTDDADIYFVSGTGTAECAFRVHGKEPEFWDPASGQIRDAVAWHATDDRRTVVPMTLPENGAVFVVFRKPALDRHLQSRPAGGAEIAGRASDGALLRIWRNEGVTLNGPWTVTFEPGRGAPASATFPELVAWDRHADEGIRHFSGKGTYRTTFSLSDGEAGGLVRLQLGEVHCLAEVRLNGHDLGVIWTDPWTVELTGVARAGRNELEIDVINTWVNRLIGDAALPKEKRITKTNVALEPGDRTLKIYQSFSARDPLMRSGLIGPVRLEFGRLENASY